MKYLSSIILFIAFMSGAFAQSPLAFHSPEAALTWNKTAHHFGEVQHQVPQSAVFTFVNQSAEPVLITQAKGSCGCTVASYTQETIPPGGTGTVQATFNAQSLGVFNKTVSVTTNASDERHTLRIQGTVVE